MDQDQDLSPVPTQVKFKVFSGLLKASRSGDGRLRLSGIASSTTKDLHGDTMQPTAIEDMERQANAGLTIFLNHSYDVPEDVAGSVERAKMHTRGVDAEGSPNYDLDFEIVINDENPRAVEAFKGIEKGAKLGLSIGAMIPENGARRNKNGSYLIDHVELLETSIVGIPANPRSWISNAVKALNVAKDAVTGSLGQPTLTLDPDTGTYNVTGSIGDFATKLNGTLPVAKATTWIETRDGDKITIGDPETAASGDGGRCRDRHAGRRSPSTPRGSRPILHHRFGRARGAGRVGDHHPDRHRGQQL
jgi:HK97 family phage prohead protease